MYFLLYSFIFPLCFTVLLEHLQRLYGYSFIFKYCQCIITATAPATLAVAILAALTLDYEVLIN
jgi:tetrahydromethanopterin S-methyltransferase subunit E